VICSVSFEPRISTLNTPLLSQNHCQSFRRLGPSLKDKYVKAYLEEEVDYRLIARR